jgi:hypothetical protein
LALAARRQGRRGLGHWEHKLHDAGVGEHVGGPPAGGALLLLVRHGVFNRCVFDFDDGLALIGCELLGVRLPGQLAAYVLQLKINARRGAARE